MQSRFVTALSFSLRNSPLRLPSSYIRALSVSDGILLAEAHADRYVAYAVFVVLDALFGPQVILLNFARRLPWVQQRALSILALLVVGNLFCMSCLCSGSRV